MEGRSRREHTRSTHCCANMAHIRQSRPDSGLSVKVKVLKTFWTAPAVSHLAEEFCAMGDAGGEVERTGNNLKRVTDFNLNVTARIWP